MKQPPAPHPIVNVTQLLADFQAAATTAGFKAAIYGGTEGFPLLALTKRNPGAHPRIYLSAGIHGDEPAPPLALLAMLRTGVFDARAHWFLCPVLNPVGLQHGTREDGHQRDLNRDYKACRSAEVRAHIAWLQAQPAFDLTLQLHEDWESQGVYLYEHNPAGSYGLTPAILRAATGCMPVEPATVIDGRTVAEPGILRPGYDPALRDDWPESIYLRQHHTPIGYTIETASSLPLPQRIRTQRAAVEAAIGALCHQS